MTGTLRRWSFGLGASVLAHLGVVGAALLGGLSGLPGPVEVQLTDVRIVEVKQLPLGAPAAGKEGKPRRARTRAAPDPEAGTLGTRADDEEEERGPAPTSNLGAYGPEGSRFTVLMRLDRLRGTDYRAPVDQLLQRLPDRRGLLEGTGLDLFDDFDAILIATPNPRDPAVTFLAVRHHMENAAMKTALGRGARSQGQTLSWRTDSGRLIGERRARGGRAPAPEAASAPAPDDRLVILAPRGLAIITPPAYRALLLGGVATPGGVRPVEGTAAARGGSDAGAPSADGGPPAEPVSWLSLLARIDAEEGLMPSDGAVMVSAVDLFRPAGSARDTAPELFGMEVPPSLKAIIGVGGAPRAEVVAAFKTEAPAIHWETQWPALQRKIRLHPLVMLGGFSPLVARATLTREGRTIRLELTVTHDEALRLLATALSFLPTYAR